MEVRQTRSITDEEAIFFTVCGDIDETIEIIDWVVLQGWINSKPDDSSGDCDLHQPGAESGGIYVLSFVRQVKRPQTLPRLRLAFFDQPAKAMLFKLRWLS